MTISEPDTLFAELITSGAAYRRNSNFIKPIWSEENSISTVVCLIENHSTFPDVVASSPITSHPSTVDAISTVPTVTYRKGILHP